MSSQGRGQSVLMSYRLKFDEPLSKGWRRIVREQIDVARGLLGSGQDVDGAIHETRKSMKRVRALLKLLRPGLSASDYKRENRRYRDIARILSGVRDHAVLAATAEALSRETQGEARSAAYALMSQAIAGAGGGSDGAAAPAAGSADRQKARRVREAMAALDVAGASLDKLKLKANSFVIVRRGVERSYRDARRDMKQALDSDEDEAFHAWRKSVQAHWRHMVLVGRAWPDLFAARAQLAKEMSDLLGLDHDLFVLVERAREEMVEDGNQEGRDALVRAARERQRQIRKSLEIKGAALFAEPTSHFVASVDAYWRAAKGARRLERKSRRGTAASVGIAVAMPDTARGVTVVAVAGSRARKAGPMATAYGSTAGGNGAGSTMGKGASSSVAKSKASAGNGAAATKGKAAPQKTATNKAPPRTKPAGGADTGKPPQKRAGPTKRAATRGQGALKRGTPDSTA